MTAFQRAYGATIEVLSGFNAKVIFAAMAGFISYSCGYDALTMEVLAYLLVVDWLFGLAVSIKHKRFSSWHLSRTLYKVFFYLLLLMVAHQVLRLSYIPAWFDEMIEMFIVLTELKSIFENSALLGFKAARQVEDKINHFLEDKLARK